MTRKPADTRAARTYNPAPRPGPKKPDSFRFTDFAMI